MKRLLKVSARAHGRGAWLFASGMALAFLAVAALASQALAQERGSATPFDLAGVVTDQAGVPLVGAWVALKGDKWGSLTDEKGRFVIPKVDPGAQTLVVEQLGYDTLTWNGTVQPDTPVALKMTAKPILLEGLHVVADRFASRRRATAATVRAYDRADLATSPQNSVLDFLTARAGVPRVGCGGFAWSSTCFLVRGRAIQPSIWLDETPLIGGMDFLTAMSPYELYMVEVIGNGRQIRLYTNRFMERAAKDGLRPFPFIL